MMLWAHSMWWDIGIALPAQESKAYLKAAGKSLVGLCSPAAVVRVGKGMCTCAKKVPIPACTKMHLQAHKICMNAPKI